jgi:hypothetical protein
VGRFKVIALEPCCGARREWKSIKPLNTIHGDKLIEVAPQIVLDFTNLPFRDNSFDQLFWDPPHLIRNDVKHFNKAYLKFGNWKTRKEWISALEHVNVEFFRVGRPKAVLFTKIIDGKDRRVTKIKDLDLLTLWEISEQSIRPSSVGWSTCNTVNTTFVSKKTEKE